MINKILVAVDFSARSQPILDSAISLAKTTGATLRLLHVVAEEEPDYPIFSTTDYYPVVFDADNYESYQEKLTKYKQKGLDFLKNLQEKTVAEGINTESIQLIGNPGRAICKEAETSQVDLIIVGSRGLKGFKEMFLGSISNYVTHHAPCSVFIVRTAINPRSNT